MPTATMPSSFSTTGFEAFLESRHEPAWVTAKRSAAFEAYIDSLSRELDPEEYRRLDLRSFKADAYSLRPTPATEVQFSTLMQDRAEFGGAVVHVDGACMQSSLHADLAKQGVLFGSLNELLQTHGKVLEPHLMTRGTGLSRDRFTAWHNAFWTGGTVLYVPRNVEIEAPLYSLNGLQGDNVADLSHTLVILEDGASATLLEETASEDSKTNGLHNGAVELLVGAGARLRYVQLQNWNSKIRHFAHQVGRVGRDGMLQWTVGALGARLQHIHQHVHLDGRGADAQVNGITFATDRQLLSYYTQQTHNAPDTHSDLLYKEVLRDQSRVVWRGMIKVEKDAQKTDGYQRNDALMLSQDARADAIPGLEIEADDVRCTHGATTGRVDEEQLFYAMCRGLPRHEAMHVIVEGFFAGVYDRIPVELVRETLGQAVQRKLGFGT